MLTVPASDKTLPQIEALEGVTTRLDEVEDLTTKIEPLEDVAIRVVNLAELGPASRAPPAAASVPREVAGRAAAPPSPRSTVPGPIASAPVMARTAGPTPAASVPPAAPASTAAAAPPASSALPGAAPRSTPATAERKRLLTWNKVGFAALVVVLYLGWSMPTERYITPTRGLGYALGIIGGSLMLLLLLYSARKHFSWLRFLGPTPSWFRFHMVLGILGPLCILFHSNFRTGAANSNVALFCMLTVAGSGFIGRYLYAHIHYGLYGRKLELGDLRTSASNLQALSGSVSFLPDLVGQLEAAEQRLLACGPQLSLFGFLKPVVVALVAAKARWKLHRCIRHGLRASARRSPVVATEAKRLRRTARAYIDRRLAATQRVAQFQAYERLFSLWHALHIPLIFMLLIAAIVHVIAVNVY